MAGRSAILSVRILTDAKGAKKGLGEAETGFAKFERGAGRAAAVATGVLAGMAVAATKLVAKAEAAATSNARLEQVFRSMGDTTGNAARDAIAYGEALARNTGIETNTVKLAQAKLATFSAVSDETARMAGIFDRTTDAAADLSAAGFGSMDSAAVMLGKALQDPIKGITSLTRVGVTFTAQEKEQIAALAKSGQALEAQRMILGAVEKQVGGVATATANSSDKMKVSWEQAQATLGTLLLPYVDKLAESVESVSGFVKENATLIMGLAAAMAALAAVVIAVNIALKVYRAIQLAIRAATIAWTAVQWLLNAAMYANPIGLVVLAIVALVAIFAIAWTKSETFRRIVTDSFRAIMQAAQWLWEKIKQLGAIMGAVFSSIKDAAGSALEWVASKIQWLMDKIRSVVDAIKSLPVVGGIIGGASYGAPSAMAYAGAGAATSSSSRSMTVNVYGALDPVATAARLRSIIRADDERFGR